MVNNTRKSSPKFIATTVALYISIISGGIIMLSIFNGVGHNNHWAFAIFAVLLIFILTYIPLYFIVSQYIIKKIEPIYEAINAIKIPSDELYENIDNMDMISELNREVIAWAQDRTKEIAQLKENEKFRKEFIGNIAHELKTPVFNIQGYVLTLLDGGLEDPNINKKYLKRSAKNIKRMIAIIKDVDTISRLETGALRLNITNFNLCKVVEEVFEMNDIRSSKYKISLKLESLPGNNVIVRADKEKIMEVINNLVVNSIKYGRESGQTVVLIQEELHKVFVSVKDNGIGISSEHLPLVYKRFYRVDKSRSREHGGSGLGLAIVKHVIEAHNETIKVESKSDVGTTFVFTLQKAPGKIQPEELSSLKSGTNT